MDRNQARLRHFLAAQNFFDAAIDPERLGLDQAAARSPDAEWPEAPMDGSRRPANER
jgi:hypothetical protein